MCKQQTILGLTKDPIGAPGSSQSLKVQHSVMPKAPVQALPKVAPQAHSPSTETYLSSARAQLLRQRLDLLVAMVAEADLLKPLVQQAKKHAAQIGLQLLNSTGKPQPLQNSCDCSLVHQSSENVADVTIYWKPEDAARGSPTCVQLKCDRDGWTQSHNLIQTADGRWSLTLPADIDSPLLFKFIVDGVWQVSPAYSTFKDSCGNNNNIAWPKLVTFSAPKCSSVSLRGSFDGWSVDHPLTLCTMSQTHNLVMLLPPGHHEIKFVCNGEWVLNPNLPVTAPGPFQNNLISA